MTKTPYFCAYHIARMKAHESEALRCWTETMHRGVRAYVACRVEAAELYLRSALDISLIRSSCKYNDIFDNTHCIKPVEFLIQIMLVDNRYNDAIIILSKLSSISEKDNRTTKISDFLAKQYERIEIAEKKHMLSHSHRTTPYKRTNNDLRLHH